MFENPPTSREINAQLELILQSREFATSERLKSFLVYVVSETLAGRGEQIKAYSVAVDVFDLGLDFDPALNPSIRVAAGRLRTKLEHYYFTSQNHDKVAITIPKGSYLPVFSYLSAIPINYSSGQNNSPRTNEIGKALEAENPTDELPVELGATAQTSENQARPRHNRPAVTVLPFVNMSSDASLDQFLLGLAEEIAIALTRFDELLVLNIHPEHTPNVDVWDLCEKIGARFVVGGSVQSSGENIRLRLQLMDAQNHSHVWAEKFDGQLSSTSLFHLQDEITGQVAARIADSFGLINRMLLKEQAEKRTADLEVYEAMLYYHHWLISLTAQRFIKVRKTLERAVNLDPAYATTKAMLSDVYASHCQWGLNIFENAIERSLELANQALELDSNCQYAHWAKAYNCYLRRDEKYFLASVYRALELNPSNTNIIATAGMKLAMIGKSDEGLEMLAKALRLNPHIPSWYHSGPFAVHYMHGEYEAALADAKQITTANFMWGPMMRAAAYGQLGRLDEGRQELTELLTIEPNFRKIGHEAMIKLFFQETTTNKMLEGLKKTGL